MRTSFGPSATRHPSIANDIPTNLKPLQTQRKTTQYIVILKAHPESMASKWSFSSKPWSPRIGNEKIRQVVIESRDVLNGSAMFVTMTSYQFLRKSQEICRMSWFLIEMDEGQSKGGKENGKIVYGVIHSIDLVDNDSTNMYINRRVRFNWNHAIIDGRVKLASDDRIFIEQQFKILTKNNEEVILKQKLSKRYLVQYNKGANTVVHAIVHQKEIVWPKEDFHNTTIREVLIRDGKIQRMATVLHVSDSDDLIQKELDMLKTRCFEAAFEEPHDNMDIEATPWLFVQYSSGPSNVSYSVINISSTVWQADNLYRNVVAYIKEGDAVFQAIIIRKSKDRNKLDAELRTMKESCLTADFPISGTSCVSSERIEEILRKHFKVSLSSLDHQGLCAKPVPIVTLKRDEYHHIIRH